MSLVEETRKSIIVESAVIIRSGIGHVIVKSAVVKSATPESVAVKSDAAVVRILDSVTCTMCVIFRVAGVNTGVENMPKSEPKGSHDDVGT